MKYFNKPKKTYPDLIAVRKIFINAGSLQYSLKEIETRMSKTLKILDKLQMNDKYREIIKGIKMLAISFSCDDTVISFNQTHLIPRVL